MTGRTLVLAVGMSLVLAGCSSVDQPAGNSGAQRSVPTLGNGEASLKQWIAFANVSRSANAGWRTQLTQALAHNDERNLMVKAVANSWSDNPDVLSQALDFYGQGMADAPSGLVPLFQLWRDQASLRLAHVQLKSAYTHSQQSGRSTTDQITRLKQENSDLKHKISELANIEASMDRQRHH